MPAALPISSKPTHAPRQVRWIGFITALLAGLSNIATAQTTRSPELIGVAHVALRVSDVNAEVRFLNKLGFQQAFAHQQDGRTAFVFVKINDIEFLEVHPRIPVNSTSPLPLGFDHICFVTTDANAARARWAKAGLNPSEVAKGPDGTLEFGAKNPSGAMTEGLQILPGSQPDMDKGQHLDGNRISDWLMGIDIPVSDVATWQKFYEGIGFISAGQAGGSVEMRSPGKPEMRIAFHADGKDNRTRILFAVKSVRKAAIQLRAAGLKVDTNTAQVIVHDPDNNTFVLHDEDARK